MTSNDPSEHSEQAALFKWAAWARNSPGIPRIKVGGAAMSALDFLHAVPNGGYRTPSTASVLKAEGVRAGVPDDLRAPEKLYPGYYCTEIARFYNDVDGMYYITMMFRKCQERKEVEWFLTKKGQRTTNRR